MNVEESFKLLVNQRLEATAQEIFHLFRNRIVQYEEEIERQRKLLAMFWKPSVQLHRVGRFTHSLQHGCSTFVSFTNGCRSQVELLTAGVFPP